MSKIIIDIDDKTHYLFKSYCLNVAKKSMKEVILKYVNRCIKRGKNIKIAG